MKTGIRIATFVAVMVGGWVWAGPTGAVQTREQVRLDLDLIDGSRVIGVPVLTSVPVQTSYAKMDIPLRQIVSMEFTADYEKVSLALRNGDSLLGVVHLEAVSLDTLFGKVEIAIVSIKQARVLLSGGPLSAAVLRGRLLHYTFDNDTGERVADASGNGRDGVMRGARWTKDGKIGGACEVGRQVGYVETPDQDVWSFSGDFSICLWVKLNSLPLGEQMIVGHDDGGGERNKWAFEFHNGNITFHINNPRSQSYRIAAVPWQPEVGRWYHLAVRRRGTTYTIYVDGAAVSKDDNTLPIPAANAPLTIGQAEGLFVEGTLDDLMIFNRALSSEEIQSVYDAGK